MHHTRKMRLTFVSLVILLLLWLVKLNQEEIQNSSSLRVDVSLRSGGESVHIKLCNSSNEDFYLPNFYTLGTHLRIYKRDPRSGKYFDYRSVFNSIAMQLALDSIPKSLFPFFQVEKSYFADHMAEELSARVSDKGRYDSNLIGDPYEEFYAILMSVQYLKGLECIEGTVDLRPIKQEKGQYKIFFEYEVLSTPLKESEGSYMYRFYQDRMPVALKGYRRWQGMTLSDTLKLEIR